MLTEGVVPSEDDGNRVCKGLGAGTSTEKIIAEIFDKSTFIEIKKGFAAEVVTGYARLNGVSVGVVASDSSVSDGRLTADGAKKVTELINTCDSFGLPIVNIVDCKGAINCLKFQGELMRSIGDMIYAYNVADVAKVSLIKGSAVGVGYTALASSNIFDYVVAWECASIGLLDNAASAELVYAAEIAKAKDRNAAAAKLAEAYREESTAAVTVAAKGYIDNVIEPNFSRQYLIAAVQAYIDKR